MSWGKADLQDGSMDG
eukprot:Gb_09615 [translate_table: standard]